MRPPLHLALDQTRPFQHLDVLRGRSQRDGEGLRQLADGPLAGGEFAQHAPAGGVAQRMKDMSQLRRLKINHVVEYMPVFWESQPSG